MHASLLPLGDSALLIHLGDEIDLVPLGPYFGEKLAVELTGDTWTPRGSCRSPFPRAPRRG